MLDVREESVRVQLAALYLLEAALPFSGEQRRAQSFGQHGHERRASICRYELAFDSLGEAAVDELLNGRRARGGGAEPAAFRVGRSLFRTGTFHSRKQRILGICYGRRGFTLF